MVNENGIQKTNVVNEYLVLSTRQDSGLFYIVNSEFERALVLQGCQGLHANIKEPSVSTKFHISMFNFIPSLMTDDRIIYTYTV